MLVAFALGWWAKGLSLSPYQPNQAEYSSGVMKQDIDQTPVVIFSPDITAVQLTPSSQKISLLSRFRTLLVAEAFDEAMNLYDEVSAIDERATQRLHHLLQNYLQECLQQQRDDALMALMDAYLSRYYDDINVLLILAEYQRRQGYVDEAARVYQQALTYAYRPEQRERVLDALSLLAKQTDTSLTQQQRWLELIAFYELLASIDLSQPVYQLRQAMLYQQEGDHTRARELLLQLQTDSQVGVEAGKRLAALEGEAFKPLAVTAVDMIPLTRRGNHYLIKVAINEVSEVTLMIDTGASMTSLSQVSFSMLAQDSHFDHLGSRLFNTANGVAQGDIYQAATLGLGDQQLQAVDFAVLDFQPQQGIDGLLGMNVLQNFRFEIDQDQQILLLRSR